MEIHQLGAIPNMPFDPIKESGVVSENPETVQTEKEKEYLDIVKKAKNKKMFLTVGAIAAAGLLYYLWKKSKK